MYFPAAFAFVLASLPFLVGAVPVHNSPRSVLSIPLSKRSTLFNADGVIDVQNLQASVDHTIAKFEQRSKTSESHTGKPHTFVSRQARQNTTSHNATISLTNNGGQNMAWYGNISVGSPAVTYTVVFDTGSADFFLPGPSCSNCVGHQIYNPALSSTAKDLGESANFVYRSDNFFGKGFTEHVVLGGFEVDNLTLLVTSDYPENLNSTSFGADGVVGMGFKGFASINTPTLFETLVDQGQLEEPIFGFYLAESGSELIIGGRDSSRYSGNLTYFNVDKKWKPWQGYWQIGSFSGISVDGNNLEALVQVQYLIFDTGTTLIVGDYRTIQDIYAKIPGSIPLPNTSLWTIPCNTNVSVSVTFGGTTFNISPETYILGAMSITTCMGGFSADAEPRSDLPLLAGYLIMGDVFLRNVYSEFDYGNLRVGFAQLANKQ